MYSLLKTITNAVAVAAVMAIIVISFFIVFSFSVGVYSFNTLFGVLD